MGSSLSACMRCVSDDSKIHESIHTPLSPEYVEEKKVDTLRNEIDKYLLPELTQIVLEYSRIKPTVSRRHDRIVVLKYLLDYKLSDDFTMKSYTNSEVYKCAVKKLGSSYAKKLLSDRKPLTKEILVYFDDMTRSIYGPMVELMGIYTIYIDITIIDGQTEIYSTRRNCLTDVYLDGDKYLVEWDKIVVGVLSGTIDSHRDLTNYSDLQDYIRYYAL